MTRTSPALPKIWQLAQIFSFLDIARFSSITINLGPTFLSGALAANADAHIHEPSCPLVQVIFSSDDITRLQQHMKPQVLLDSDPRARPHPLDDRLDRHVLSSRVHTGITSSTPSGSWSTFSASCSPSTRFQLMDKFWNRIQIFLWKLKALVGFHDYFLFPQPPMQNMWEFFFITFSSQAATLAPRLHNKECGGGEITFLWSFICTGWFFHCYPPISVPKRKPPSSQLRPFLVLAFTGTAAVIGYFAFWYWKLLFRSVRLSMSRWGLQDSSQRWSTCSNRKKWEKSL